jgi:glycosyltransferase involved in cell wall biosynthesis
LPDVEVLVVDDGSTDGTLAAIEHCAARDPRVRVMSQPNGGVAMARNRAIAEARAPYIALLDSDDEWMPTYLERQLAVLAREPEASVVTRNAFNRGGPYDGQPFWPPAPNEVTPLSLLDMVDREDSVCIMSVFKREMHQAIGGWDEHFRGGSEDYDFWLRAAASGYKFVSAATPLAYYQRRPDSMSARPLPMLAGISASLRKLRDRLDPDDDAAVVRAIDRKMAQFHHERLTIEAKNALRAGDFSTAAQRFNELRIRQGGARLGLIAAWSRLAPASLAWVDSMRQSMRPAAGR